MIRHIYRCDVCGTECENPEGRIPKEAIGEWLLFCPKCSIIEWEERISSDTVYLDSDSGPLTIYSTPGHVTTTSIQ